MVRRQLQQTDLRLRIDIGVFEAKLAITGLVKFFTHYANGIGVYGQVIDGKMNQSKKKVFPLACLV